MSAKLQLRLMVAVLLLIGFGLTAYKVVVLKFPLTPGEQEQVWTVQAQLRFTADGQPVRAQVNLPGMTQSLYVVDQGSAPRGFGFYVEQSDGFRRGVWEARAPQGDVRLYYQARVYASGGVVAKRPAPDALPDPAPFAEADVEAANDILEDAFRYSADNTGFALRLTNRVFNDITDPAVTTLAGDKAKTADRAALVVRLLQSAEINAAVVRGIRLDKSERKQSLATVIEIWDGTRWQVIDPVAGSVGMPDNFLPWQTGDEFLFQVDGAKDSSLTFSVIRDQISSRSLAIEQGQSKGVALINFSLFSLPVDVQNTFSMLLLIPIGALVVVVLRNLVGLKTSGTFMPVLIALVFVQTELLTGLILFVTVVGVGLVIRGYLTSLNLLLVPRIAAVLIVVITLYLMLSVIGYRMGVEAALSVTFFPMIIIAWTIERMSVLAEEEAMWDVLVQGGGSLLTAILAYLAMTNREIAYLTFAYPELLLVVLAVILVIGQYTGFRLSELRRFEPLSRGE
ncbi:UUP1 family membrane protein [Shimia biformata]|uniref:UUP1 family membrane protein n=1 Tax=Shimia biformata TaxID=1294299 RepID=UPI00194F6A6A|nr:UUP1 family membrane protein [Shimia biformata]